MTRFGYTLMTEQNGPKDIVRYAVSAEYRGFDFEVSSDHFSPWLTSQGHAPNTWAVLGAVAQATERVGLYTYVTCPTMRYHPAIVAPQAATVHSPSFDDDPVMEFFTMSTTNLLTAAKFARVGHYVVVSIVGCDELPGETKTVVVDPHAAYFGTPLSTNSLVTP